ncbi:antibiotic biosynthesis monooxygenase [Actinoplanes italicus]|uniref:Autoinducer 2-degrading protein n=1 Tax=Actinoplanes italicus TaxID=113567 RepID=A0A2T0K039_9ACTN|nr:putative quinol monooxygenase [Actinoplanes italicus]PRX15929.1 autoinducer 2-degrading protein [Actinoplanes italicus]GIE28729.1 antibiotic biosynthesis monooxygenase [Actinoplanes italicus]
MFTVIVTVDVRPDRVGEFLEGITANARASLRDEPGCLRFDVHRVDDQPHRFLLHEIYTGEQAFYRAHREAPHYADWLKVVDRCVLAKSNLYATPILPAEQR